MKFAPLGSPKFCTNALKVQRSYEAVKITIHWASGLTTAST